MTKKIISTVFICLAAFCLLTAFTGYCQVDAEVLVINQILEEHIKQTEKWERKANIIIFLNILVGALGVTIGLLQKKNKNGVKLLR